jgi:hypothetical protein
VSRPAECPTVPDPLRAALPARCDCDGCDETVLLARGRWGNVVKLDPEELLPIMECPVCRSKRQRDYGVPCWRCGDTRQIGSALESEPRLYLLPASGVARLWRPRTPDSREHGDAVYRPHVCQRKELSTAA